VFSSFLLVKTEVQAVVLDKQMVELGMMANTDSELEWNYLPDSMADSASKRNLGDFADLDSKSPKMVHSWVFCTH
jgi:hypothetical protein